MVVGERVEFAAQGSPQLLEVQVEVVGGWRAHCVGLHLHPSHS